MKRAKIGDIQKAVARAVGFTPGEIRVGERAADASGGTSFNVFEWVPNVDLFDHPELKVWILKRLDYSKGVMLDLYVYLPKDAYGPGDLETNVTVVIDSNCEVVVAYDSVSATGMVYDEWWMQR